ncbi:hypothetical protein CMK22_01185 [Candidatus Poribacteria bacterium]|nr:hypothetical protein [Candidatus Poribacteria bacterium]
MATNGIGDWYSITETLDKLNISLGTLYKQINEGELKYKKDGDHQFVWIDNTVDLGNKTYTNTTGTQENDIIKELINQVEYLKSQVEELETALKGQSLKHNTTIFKIINQNQALMERAKKKPFWRKFFNSIISI